MKSHHPLFILTLILLSFYTKARTLQPSTMNPLHHPSTPNRFVFAEDHPTRRPNHADHPYMLQATIAFAVGYALGTAAFLLWRLAVRCFRHRVHCFDEPTTSPTSTTLFSPLIKSPNDLRFLQSPRIDQDQDRDRDSPSLEIIGRGGCGEVYKTELRTGGRTIVIAIKMILQPFAIDAARLAEDESDVLNHRIRQVRSEIRTVGRMRHPNLLRLLAHVPRPECHYLVYEYMSNGSLHDALRSSPELLQWPQRLKIAVGVASGLEYLHMVHRPRVIHRDLKPANILLDDELNARISDFGLAKVVPDAARMSGAMSTNVAGTVGYIAPEYYQMMSCTDKCDVYSFGVILAVLVTGKFPNDRFFEGTDEMCIMGWARRVLRSEEPSSAIDEVLLGKGFEEQMLLVLKIACFCMYDDPCQRPNSRDVRCMLSQIKHNHDAAAVNPIN